MKIAVSAWGSFIVLLASIMPVHGLAVYDFEVDEAGFTTVKIEHPSTEDQTSLLVLPFPLADIVVYGEFWPLLFDYVESETESGVIIHSLTEEVYIEGMTSSLTSKQGSEWVFQTNIALDKGDEVSVTLPPNAKLGRFSPGEEAKVGAEKNRVVLTWALQEDNVNFEIESYYTMDNRAGGVPDSLYLLVLLGAGMVFYAVFKAKRRDARKRLLDLFDAKERRVIQLLQGRSSVKQKELQLETGFSKSTLSVVLKRLENKKAITRRQRGRINLVELNREVFE